MYYLTVCLCVMAVNVAQSTLSQLPKGISLHKGIVSWDEARIQCLTEGRTIASPINNKALNAMKSVIGSYNNTYFIGTKAIDKPGQFVSIEGVSIEDMPLAVTLDMVYELDQWEGDCLAMSRDNIRAVPCSSRLPYMCYDTYNYNIDNKRCGLNDEGYKYESVTNSCYKLHPYSRNWDEAHWICASEGAYLAIIEDANETNMINDNYDLGRYTYTFIGYRKKSQVGGWTSVHGQPLPQLYKIFLTDPHLNMLDCGALDYSGKWQNIQCESLGQFLCEMDPRL